MTKSRMAALLFAAAQAQPLTAEQAIENYRTMVSDGTAGAACAEPDEPDVITVCGKKDRSQRVGPSDEPGARTGGVPSGTEALASAEACISRCPQPVQVDLFKAADFLVRGISRLLDPDN